MEAGYKIKPLISNHNNYVWKYQQFVVATYSESGSGLQIYKSVQKHCHLNVGRLTIAQDGFTLQHHLFYQVMCFQSHDTTPIMCQQSHDTIRVTVTLTATILTDYRATYFTQIML